MIRGCGCFFMQRYGGEAVNEAEVEPQRGIR
jgi:hypothetical protein